jgi:MraZ protein
MTGFLGEFEATVDAKGRFLLPVGFKKQMADDEPMRFVINRGFEKCLSLYTQKTWEIEYEKLSKLSDYDPEEREFKRYFLNGATRHSRKNPVAAKLKAACRPGKRHYADGNGQQIRNMG